MKKLMIVIACLVIAMPGITYAQKDKKEKKQKTIPPGLAKKVEQGGELPPGWQKKIKKGAVMDQELFETAQPLPETDDARYPGSTIGTKLIKIEDKIIRIKNDTHEILEIFGVQTD